MNYDNQIVLATKIATMLYDAKLQGPDGASILAMALGIYVESHPDSHRELAPLCEGMLKAAQIAFDALREASSREPS